MASPAVTVLFTGNTLQVTLGTFVKTVWEVLAVETRKPSSTVLTSPLIPTQEDSQHILIIIMWTTHGQYTFVGILQFLDIQIFPMILNSQQDLEALFLLLSGLSCAFLSMNIEIKQEW